MSIIKQLTLSAGTVLAALFVWVYFFPSAIDTLGAYNLDVAPLKQIAALNQPDPSAGAGSQTGNRARGGRFRQPLVITAPVFEAVVNDRLTAIGNGRANQSVTVTPLVSGQITELAVMSGNKVERGDVLARLDADSEEIARDRAVLTAEDLRAKVTRAEELLRRRSISAVEVENARAALGIAELAVREAELDVERRTIRSPIDGIVGIVTANVGDYVTNQSPIVTVDDRSSIIVEYFVPERFAPAVESGAVVEASSIARPGEVFSGTVVAIDNRIDVASRTLRVRAEIDNEADKLRAGMAFRVTMRFDGDTFPAVDPLAIQWDSDGSYVWQIGPDGKAKRQAARIVQRNANAVLVDAPLREGDVVITEGVQNVRSGAEVRVAGERRENTDPAAGQPGAGS